MRKALFGLEPDAYRRHRDITGSILADLAEPILTKPGPNLIVVWRSKIWADVRYDHDASEPRIPDHTASAA